ncbi:MAG: outer membrane beta-barrel protein [Bryobacterales bacterium]|nr:outer membrane beta-barrel protein [Bryobacterales bacterium]
MRTFFLMILGTSLALAQSAEFSVTGGVSRLNNNQLGGFSDASGTTNFSLRDGWRFGFRTTVNPMRFFGHEFGYGYNRTQLRVEETGTETGMAIHQGFYNFLVYATPDGAKVRPFAAGGAHFSNYTPPGTSVTSGGGSAKIGFNYGGGVKFRLSHMFGLRFDVRQYQNGKPFDFLQNRKGLIGQLEVSLGFGLVI